MFGEFLTYLRCQPSTKALYILGDLFEAWPGDDVIDSHPFPRRIVDALHAFSTSGVALFVMEGNRDFLIGKSFAEQSGATLIDDPFSISFNSFAAPFLLSHGDAFCTADKAYQQIRADIRHPQWQAAFLNKPLEERIALAAALRKQSENAKQSPKDPSFMDVEIETVEALMRENAYPTLIHGHTHRPATHTHHVDEVTAERWVLSDWHEDHGDYLVLNEETGVLERIIWRGLS